MGIHAKWSDRMTRVVSVLTAFLSLACMLVAQAQQQEPTPSPAQQMMGYFVGDWKLEGTMKVSPTVAAAPFTSAPATVGGT